ncbi:cysteine-rich receptor-like protein kinase 10 isoform X2 [Cornus florida]|uniref:cysteine-rich receptor-like protein kinase 10 isoform X2 n=1 Tax=Cornus florida TaxID=4283 RepID=UPI00289E4CE4|nr:cysteine-rich receptor-like protein kinase 10 isoform X2 [Cornus florida]
MMFSVYTYSFCNTFVIVTILWLLIPNTITKVAPTYAHSCFDTTITYTPNTTFESNLNLLFSTLSSNATNNINGFYNATAGLDAPDVAYGLFLCRGDIAGTNECQDCVALAGTEIVKLCPNQKRAFIWLDKCMLHYANHSFFSTSVESPVIILYNVQNITEQDRFEQLLGETMDVLATRASNDESGNVTRFATQEVNFTAFQKLYSLTQCTQDLSQIDCDRCLRIGISNRPTDLVGKQGAAIFIPSCYIRYEVYPFFNSTATDPPRPTSPPPPPPPPPLPPPNPLASPKGERIISVKTTIIAVVASIVVSAVLLSVGLCFLVRRGRKRYYTIEKENVGSDITIVESLKFDLGTIEAATNNFSIDNKIGQGGFGQVYKGSLRDGQDIAVKRLSKTSAQGATEFKNEVVVVAKLQHRNLARLLGFCLTEEEKILIYEYICNKSLDYFLFDPEKQRQLDWSRRYNIIEGIARGMLYLHEDSQLRIIHRDLKASNILLDGEMNPKISDFGMAKIFGVDQSQGNTRRIAGTFGYMPPEYVMHGKFSVKSDVFSFGVLVLEIISGRKNGYFHQSSSGESLPSYAWKQWRNGTPLELMDSTLKNSYSSNEVVRCIHIGLLCVQEDMVARPSMASVSVMLNSLSVSLPLPRKPAFFVHSRTEYLSSPNGFKSNQRTSKSKESSRNEASITELYPR